MQEANTESYDFDFKKREKTILHASYLGIVGNILLAAVKAIMGYFTGSIAIMTDAANNLTDMISSLITLIGMKAAELRPDHAHPFGHGRFEYISAIIIGNIILLTGIFAIKESFSKILHPTETSYTAVTVTLMVVAVAVKLFLAFYFRKKGESANSDALLANGEDSQSDALLTSAVLTAVILKTLFDIQIEAYVSLILAAVITWNGFNIIVGMITTLLGKKANPQICDKLIDELRRETDIMDVSNLVLHDYGPITTIGSLDVKVNSMMRAEEIAKLEAHIKEIAQVEYGIRLSSVGIYI